MALNRQATILRLYRERHGKPFVWGKLDCIHWCGDVALALTGHDPIKPIRNGYDSEIGAKRLMVANGCHGLRDVALKAYGEIPVAMAQTGDWAVIKNPDGSEFLGVVSGANVVSLTQQDGIWGVPRSSAYTAFKVK